MTDNAPMREHPHTRKPCCCPPQALVGWIDTRTTSIFVENRIDMHRRLEVRADVSAIAVPPQDASSDGASKSELDEASPRERVRWQQSRSFRPHLRCAD